MKKAMINYWVDMVIGVAFVLCVITGLARLFPETTVTISSAGTATILGVPMSVWQTIHDWSGVAMTAGVGVHLALHLRWMITMTGRVVRGQTGNRERATQPARAARSAQPVPGAATVQGLQPVPVHTQPAPMAVRSERPSRHAQTGVTRKGFLAAVGVAGGAALLGGIGAWSIFGGKSDAASSTTTSSGTSNGNGNAGGTATQTETDATTGDSSYGENSAGSSSDTSTSTTVAERVVIDADACTGCGHCVQVCPYGALGWDGHKAYVQNADACQLCGHCVSACRPRAITLNA